MLFGLLILIFVFFNGTFAEKDPRYYRDMCCKHTFPNGCVKYCEEIAPIPSNKDQCFPYIDQMFTCAEEGMIKMRMHQTYFYFDGNIHVMHIEWEHVPNTHFYEITYQGIRDLNGKNIDGYKYKKHIGAPASKANFRPNGLFNAYSVSISAFEPYTWKSPTFTMSFVHEYAGPPKYLYAFIRDTHESVTRVELQWRNPTFGSDKVVAYIIYFQQLLESMDPIGPLHQVSVSSQHQTYTLANLHRDVFYRIYIRADTGYFKSVKSNEVIIITNRFWARSSSYAVVFG